MISKIVYVLRIIAVLLIVLLILAKVFDWTIQATLLKVFIIFVLFYVLSSMLLLIIRFKRIHRPPTKPDQGIPEISDTPEDTTGENK